jgi:hypothetical protein
MTGRILLAFALTVLTAFQPSTSKEARDNPVSLVEGSQARAISPDGRWELLVPQPHGRVSPWLILQSREIPGYQEQRWPLQRGGCYVLWRPDSKAFALTDLPYADHYFIRVMSVDFRTEGDVLGAPVIDLSVPLEKAFKELAGRHYGSNQYEIDLFLPKALRWIGNDELLVGLQARTNEAWHGPGSAPRIRDWYLGYIMIPERRQIIRQPDAAAVLREFGIDLEKETW